jgi:hypothetical protein
VTQPLSLFYSDTKWTKSQDSVLWDEVRKIFAGFERTAFAKELSAVFDNLHDQELLEALQRTRWTGRPGFPIKVMWRTLVASYVLNIATIQELIRTLHRNPFVAVQCGICSDNAVPTRFAYYRFIKKLMAHEDLIEKCMAKTIETLKKRLPDLGKTVAVDSTAISTYANRFKKPNSDPEAGWGVKANGAGEREIWLGYKMHLVADATHEIPMMPIVTAANTNDSIEMIPVLKKTRTLIDHFSPDFVLADKGYDATENYKAIVEDFKAVPVIDLNLRGLRKRRNRFEDVADDYGTPHCAWGIPMVFWGYDKKQKRLKYRCPQACGKKGCTWIDKCSKSAYGHVVKINLKDDYRRFIAVPRHTETWRKRYNMRTSIERIFARLKKDGEGRLVNHRIRGLNKVTVNCLLSVWVMQTKMIPKMGFAP